MSLVQCLLQTQSQPMTEPFLHSPFPAAISVSRKTADPSVSHRTSHLRHFISCLQRPHFTAVRQTAAYTTANTFASYNTSRISVSIGLSGNHIPERDREFCVNPMRRIMKMQYEGGERMLPPLITTCQET